MSERELQRIEVLSKVLERRMTVVSAAHVLDMTTRQVQRLLKAFRAEGAAALRHKARGRPSNHRYVAGVGELAVQLVREHYLDFGPTLAHEKLIELHRISVAKETLRQWMTEAGIWISRFGAPVQTRIWVIGATLNSRVRVADGVRLVP